jgi:hypothetical protein
MNSTLGPRMSGKSVSCDAIKANSCIELADIRKLDSLLNQCESISCDNLLLYDEIYNYDLCTATKRKYVSTSALHILLPKNSIRRRAHKKVLGIREQDSKIIKLIDDKRHRESGTGDDAENDTGGEMMKCCEVSSDTERLVDVGPDEDDLLRTQSCSNLLCQPLPASTAPSPITTINCCDKTIQTSYGELFGQAESVACKYLSTDGTCNNQIQQTQDSRKKTKRKQCSCRNYENVNIICETSLSTPPKASKKSLLQLKKEKSNEKSSRSRLMKQKTSIMDDDECETRVININEKSVEIFPISLNSSHSQSVTPRGTSTNLHLDSNVDKSETQSQKSKRSKFSPSFISRKLTSRLNSSEDDGAGGVKESLLGRSKSADKKLPEPVETVCIDNQR